MLIISYRPGDDQFWIGCTMAEAGAELKVCYYDVPHHPFHHLWNAYSPFAKCDIIEISDISELETVKPVVRD